MTENGIEDKTFNQRNKNYAAWIDSQRSVANTRRKDDERNAVASRDSEQYSHCGQAADRNGHSNKKSLITPDVPVRQILSCFLKQK
jgi:hypothetical protein